MRFGAGMLGVAAGCRWRVLLEGAAVSRCRVLLQGVLFVLWSLVAGAAAGAAAGCRFRVLLLWSVFGAS